MSSDEIPTSESGAQETGRRRPRVVTFVGVVVYLLGLIPTVTAIGLFLNRDSSAWQVAYDASEAELLLLAIIHGVLAVLFSLVARGLMSGARWSRPALGIVIGLLLAIWPVASMVLDLSVVAFRRPATAIWLGVGVIMLWILYGTAKARSFYDGSV